MEGLRLEIITPEYSMEFDAVSSVLLPTVLGQVGIYPQHTGILMVLEAGVLQYNRQGVTHTVSIKSGIAEVNNNVLVVLTDAAEV